MARHRYFDKTGQSGGFGRFILLIAGLFLAALILLGSVVFAFSGR